MALSIVLERDELLLACKPAGQLVHPTKPGGPRTLLDELRDAYPGERLSLVNRLDRETSGLVLVARHPDAAAELGRMMRRGEIEKSYLAIVWGEIRGERGEIHAPLDRLGGHAPSQIYLKQAIVPGGHVSKTEYRVERRLRGHTLLRLWPRSGRLHQIRAHLAGIGFPIIGDKLYGPDERLYLRFIKEGWTDDLKKALLCPRHALHADYVAFSLRGSLVQAQAKWPDDLNDIWNTLMHK